MAGKLKAVVPDTPRETGWITSAEAARALRMTPQSLSAWTKRPDAPVRVDGTRVWVRDPDFFRWRDEELKRAAKAELAPTVSLDEARTRKALAEAELAELDVAKARGEWVSVADYETALARILDREMARLRALPVRLAHFGPEVEAAAEEEIERMVNEMAGMDDDVIDEPAEAKEAA